MKVTGIICEYNPFHNGHAYQIAQIKQQKNTAVVCIMSSSFVQRGGMAVFDKWTRTRAALKCGADLVIELPVAFANASAERFARCGVYLLDCLGCVDTLCFGTETGDIAQLQMLAEACVQAQEQGCLDLFLKAGYSYPVARQMAVETLIGSEYSALLELPNAGLGIEYLKALQSLKSKIDPMTIKRIAVEHHSREVSDHFASATYLRELIKAGSNSAISKFVPDSTYQIYQSATPVEHEKLQQILLFCIRNMTKGKWAEVPDVTEGLENRLYEAARTTNSVEQFLETVKTKRYTRTRLNRIVYAALLGITKTDLTVMPDYIRVLGANSTGIKILQLCKTTSKLIVTPMVKQLAKQSHRHLELEIRATDLMSQCMTPMRACGEDFVHPAIIIKN